MVITSRDKKGWIIINFDPAFLFIHFQFNLYYTVFSSSFVIFFIYNYTEIGSILKRKESDPFILSYPHPYGRIAIIRIHQKLLF